MKKRIIGLILFLTIILSVQAPFSLIVNAEGENVAVDKPVSCSTYNTNYPAKNVNDGNLNVFWASGSEKDKGLSGENDFIQIDLEEKYKIHKIIVRSRRDMDQSGSRENWILYGANTADFSDKVELGQKKYAGDFKSDLVAEFTVPVEYRYVRLERKGYTVIAEIEVYGISSAVSSKQRPEYSDIENPKELDSAILIENLGIINSVNSTTYGKDFLVAAEEAAVMVAKAKGMKIGQELSSEQAYLEALNYGIKLPTGVARTDYISKLDFIYMMELAFGYGPYFEVFGEYPQGVIDLGIELELYDLNDGSLQDNASKIEIACIISNFLKSSSIQLSTSGGNVVYNSSDITWLEKIFNLKLNEGVVTSNYYTTLFEPKESFGSGAIDNISYPDDNSLLNDFIGKNIIYLTDTNESDAIRFAWENKSKNQILEITASDIKNVNNNSIETYISGHKRIRLQYPYNVIRNGVAYLNFDPELDFYNDLATFVFIDNDNDGIYEVIYYEDPVLVISDYIAVNDGTELLVNGQNNINIKISDYQDMDVYIDGKNSSIGSIPKGSLVYLYYSEDNNVVRIEVSSKNIVGRLSSINNNNIVVDGESFEVTDYFKKHKQEMSCVKVGEIAQFLLDKDGKVVIGIDSGIFDSDRKFCLIVSAIYSDLEEPHIKLYDETGAIKDLFVANKVTIDGRRKSKYELNDIISANNQVYRNKAAVYRTNSNGEIVFLDTEEYNPAYESEDSLQRMDVDTSDTRSSGTGLYDDHKMLLPIDPSAKLIIVPIIEGKVADHDYYSHLFSCREIGSVLTPGTSVSTNGYRFYNADEFGCPQYAIRLDGVDYLDGLASVTSPTANSMLITEMWIEYDVNTDEVLTAIKGIVLQNGLSTTIYVKPELNRMYDLNKIYTEKAGWLNNYKNIIEGAVDDIEGYVCQVDELETGDIIRYQISNSRVTMLERVLDRSAARKNGLELSLGNNNAVITSWFRLVSGSVDWIKDVKVGMNTMNTIEVFDYSLLNSVIVCDGNYVNSYKASTLPMHAETGDTCVFYMSNASPKLLILYK